MEMTATDKDEGKETDEEKDEETDVEKVTWIEMS